MPSYTLLDVTEDTLSTIGGINPTDTSCSLTVGNFGSPTYKIIVAFDPDSTDSYEQVRMTVNGATVTQMERGFNGTTATSHDEDCTVRMIMPAFLFNELMGTQENGWVNVPSYVTATYGSATTFTLAGDWTSILSKGDKVRLTNASTKYFYVTALSFASSLTTVTVTGGSDYTLASGAISSVSYSKASSPSGHPIWFNHTTSATGFSATTTNLARFTMVGSTCFLSGRVEGTSSATTFSITAPVAFLDSNSGNFAISGTLGRTVDNGTVSTTAGMWALDAGSSTVNLYKDMSQGATAWTASGTKGARFSAIAYQF